MPRKNSGGPRSGLYSEQRFTNWTRHDPYWSEVDALPPSMAPRASIELPNGSALPIFDRPLAEGFLRPWSIQDVVGVLTAIPEGLLDGLSGVYLLGGTARQRQGKTFLYGMYQGSRIFLFPLQARMLSQIWKHRPKPNIEKNYTKFGATITSNGKGQVVLSFDAKSLRAFYLYDVLLHEVGHHVDEADSSPNRERYANWFAEYQYARIRELRESQT